MSISVMTTSHLKMHAEPIVKILHKITYRMLHNRLAIILKVIQEVMSSKYCGV
jgi:hypothetical protein